MDLKSVAKHEGFGDQMAEVDRAIRDIMESEGYSEEFFVAPGVPRIRPVLIYLSSEIGALASQESAERGRLMHLALSAELFYSAVLVHDLALGESGSKRRAVLKKILGRALRLHPKAYEPAGEDGERRLSTALQGRGQCDQGPARSRCAGRGREG